ncbi:BREX-1 system adenine-specific DNA-methyltransferase PglX [Odoribacter sp. OttesenSCG-928-J03]|nr:BREX-1 system adenine-specific DNA-methyltransferase PglX [Odoribacter sp. OttesenSCG-928-J03]
MNLKEYFQKEYQGRDSFLEKVIFPIFGEELFEDGYNESLLEHNPELQPLAISTGIESICRIGRIDLPFNPIDIFDITVTDHVQMARNRVTIQMLVRRIMNTYSSAFMIFHYSDNDNWDWRFSFCNKRKNNEDSSDSKRYTFLLGPNQSCRTAADNFDTLLQKQGNIELNDIISAFDVEALSKEFFGKYKIHYQRFVDYMCDGANGMRADFVDTAFDHTGMTADKIRDREEKPIRDYVKKLLGRIVFLHFLQKKGWMGVPCNKQWGQGDSNFMKHLFEKSTENQKENFLDEILEPLFSALDKDRTSDDDIFDVNVNLDGGSVVKIPYLNGGLFERDVLDEPDSRFPAHFFAELFEFFYQYNFTIDENDPNDAQVGVDPEMLGRIFENLLEDNKDKGAFYTPKEIVQYMCRESLITYLQTDIEAEETKVNIETFVKTYDVAILGGKDSALAHSINEKLKNVKICDPAIGSGAFPMGLLKELFLCSGAIEEFNNAAEIKRHIIQQNIYGVDIEKGAIDIARLRFWLSLIVDEETPHSLPNLDFKIMQGNSLLESFMGYDLSSIMDDEKEIIKKNNGVLKIAFEEADTKKNIQFFINEYFNEHNHDRKAQIRQSIENAIKDHIKVSSGHNPQVVSAVDELTIPNDKFFLWHTYFGDVFNRPSKCGFDIVIGNPPYVSTKGVTSANKKLYETEFGFSDDTYNLFTFKGLGLTKENGSLTYIIPKTFWTTQTKRNMRELILGKTINYIFDTANPFESAMVDTCVVQVINKPYEKKHKVKVLDGSKDLRTPIKLTPVSQSVYRETQNLVIFKPTEYNMKIWNLYGKKVKELYDKWWDKIETSKKIAQNSKELEEYRANLKPGDIALLGCLTEGGQGLATANNGKYIAVRKSTKWAKNIIESRPKKLMEAVRKHKINEQELDGLSPQEFLKVKTEQEIAITFDTLKEKYGRDIFGQGYLYRLIDDDEIADVDYLSDAEKENGIDTSKKHYVPYDKGDKDGNRWYLETPFAIAWSKENVRFLKTNSGKKGEGMPVVRNPQFYFREGFCWSDINTTFLKCRQKQKSINDVKSMSLYSLTDKAPEYYIICVINSVFMSYYVDDFVNNTQTFQINDARQLPIVIPTEKDLSLFKDLFDKIIQLKKTSIVKNSNQSVMEEISLIEQKLNYCICELYRA